MRIVDIREHSVPISRYADSGLPSGGLTTSVVAVVTDAVRDGRPVVGYGFASFGRFAQGGLIRERFAPRLRQAPPEALLTDDGATFDPDRTWAAMMAGEKPGGHGERCVAVGTLDMAIWDATAKIAGEPLYRVVANRLGTTPPADPRVAVYGCGGYLYPENDISRLTAEIRHFQDLGYTHAKIKIGAAPLAQDIKRVEAVLRLLPAERLAVDAMNAYGRDACLTAVATLAPFGLWWFEDICDPLDFATQVDAAAIYAPPIAAGEALFSLTEALLLHRHGGLRPDRDILLFDPVHCYGLTHYVRIVEALTGAGWPRRAFWPHGGHLLSLHVACALELGGSEVNPLCFQPFGGLADDAQVVDGVTKPPEAPGVGFESKAELYALLRASLGV